MFMSNKLKKSETQCGLRCIVKSRRILIGCLMNEKVAPQRVITGRRTVKTQLKNPQGAGLTEDINNGFIPFRRANHCAC